MSLKHFVQPADMIHASDPDRLVQSDPSQAIKFDALAELRKMDDGTLYQGSEFRRVASLQAPLENLMKCFDPEFMKSKRNFYAWLDSGKNKAYCTYDRRDAATREAIFQRDFGHLFKEKSDGHDLLAAQ